MAISSFSTTIPGFANANRIAAVRQLHILDTPPEAAFDDAVVIAAQACQTPAASIGFLIEGRHWFKAKIGFDEAEIPADLSICAYTIQQPGLTVFPDLREHPEFCHNPFVTGGPGLRFYAGIPLRDENDIPIGTLTVVDREPRPEGLSQVQERTLLALARSIQREMQLREAERELAQKSEMLDRLHASSEDCIKVLDLDGRLRFMSEGGCRAMEVQTFADIEGCDWLDFWSGTRLCGNALIC